MTLQGTSAVVLHTHRTDVAQPPSSVLDVVTVPHQELGAGQVRVGTLSQQVIAASGDRMCETTRIPARGFRAGGLGHGGAVGRVVEARVAGLAAGTVVQHMSGWREESILNADEGLPMP